MGGGGSVRQRSGCGQHPQPVCRTRSRHWLKHTFWSWRSRPCQGLTRRGLCRWKSPLWRPHKGRLTASSHAQPLPTLGLLACSLARQRARGSGVYLRSRLGVGLGLRLGLGLGGRAHSCSGVGVGVRVGLGLRARARVRVRVRARVRARVRVRGR